MKEIGPYMVTHKCTLTVSSLQRLSLPLPTSCAQQHFGPYMVRKLAKE